MRRVIASRVALAVSCTLAVSTPAAGHPGHDHVSTTFDAAGVISAPTGFARFGTALAVTPDDGCGSVQTGRVFVTGHDPDYHAIAAGGGNNNGARNILQRAVAYVTADAADPSLLLVTSTSSTGDGTLDPRTGLTEAGLSFDTAHAGAAGAGVLDLDTVDFGAYDAVIVASDFGGWLSQAEVNALNARSSALASYIAGGGGVIALAESVVSNAYGFLPFLVSHVPDNAHEDSLALTPFGGELGLVDGDVNGNFYHSIFSDGGVLQPVDVDTMGTQDTGDDQIISLAGRLCSTLTVKKNVVNDDGGQALPSSFSLHVRSGGNDVAGSPQAGTSVGTTYALAPGAYSVGEDGSPAYTATITGGCAGTGAITLSAGEDATCTVTNDDRAVQRHLAVTKSGTGSGTVTSAPAAISCGATCGAEFDDGTSVTLHALADAGSSFSGWSGAGCSGTNDCVLAMDGAKAVTATFTATPQPPVDNVVPNLHISQPVHETTIADSTPTYLGDGGTAPGDAATVTVDIYPGINPTLFGPPAQTLTAPVVGGIWTVDGSPPLPDGIYTIRAWQLDAAGNFGSSNIPFFTIDTTAPTVAITAPANGSSGADTTPTITGTAGNATGDATSVAVRLYSGPTGSGTPLQNLTAPRSGTAWTIDAATLAPGTYTVDASQADGVGNTGTSTPVTFKVATTGGGIGPTPIPPPQHITDFICAFRPGKCKGLPIQTTFTASPGNAVWNVGAFSISRTGTAAARRTLALGKLSKRITKNGTVKVVFKVKGAKARRLVKEIRKRKLNRLEIKLKYTPDGKPTVVQISIVKLSKL